MVINDHRVENRLHERVCYHMWNTWDLFDDHKPASEIAQSINEVAGSAPGGRLRNLVINCHGEPGMLALGQIITRNDLRHFDILQGKIDTIYLLACLVGRIINAEWLQGNLPPALSHGNLETMANNMDGNIFCSELARRVHCTVVASNEYQATGNGPNPYGTIDEFEGLVLWYGPGGNVVQWERYHSNSIETTGGPQMLPDENINPIEVSWRQQERTRIKLHRNPIR